MDLTPLSVDELRELRSDIDEEIERRNSAENVSSRISKLNMQYLMSAGVRSGEEWEQPTGAHNAYPRFWEVTHGGKRWESLTAGNVWEPGVSGWREVVEEGDAPADFIQPTGAHDAYQTGERVTFDGEVYESSIDGNVWSPTDNPDGWIQIVEPDPEPAPDPEPEPEPDPEPEPEPEPTVDPWKQPTGAHDAYNTGDRVTFEGSVYESTIDANTYSPTDYPQGWELIE